MEYDDFLLWFIEQAHSSYLTWVAIWLAGGLGFIEVLMSENTYLSLIIIGMLIVGMAFAVWRNIHNTEITVKAFKQINDTKIQDYLFNNRGSISKFFVDDDANICIINTIVFLLFQSTVLGLIYIWKFISIS